MERASGWPNPKNIKMPDSWNSYEIFPGMPYSTMVLVEGGSFMMDNRIECKVNSFYLGQFLVTQGLWDSIVREDSSRLRGNSMTPVTELSWYDCTEFLERLNKRLGLMNRVPYRLPSEVEWEYAARGGKYTRKTEYAGSGMLKEVGWSGSLLTEKGLSHGDAEVTGLRTPNELGLYDLSGNLFEWCSDLYRNNLEAPPKDPLSDNSEGDRVLRAGSFLHVSEFSRIDYRFSGLSFASDTVNGFRLARSVF